MVKFTFVLCSFQADTEIMMNKLQYILAYFHSVIRSSWGKGEEGGQDNTCNHYAYQVWSFKTKTQAVANGE